VNGSKAIIDYVSKDRNALGFISLAWLSDNEDSVTNNFLSVIRVCEVAPADTSKSGGYYYKPYLANIALQKYPLMRSIYIISKEARAGLGLGFTSFAAGDKGQRIVLKAGLLPATMPIRLVEVDNENLQIEREQK
jgi:phosphate transport system substrate-binding protein